MAHEAPRGKQKKYMRHSFRVYVIMMCFLLSGVISLCAERAKEDAMEKVIFGAGCFWGVEEAFRTLPGVSRTRVGYSAGHTLNPTYRDVCTDQTGHAEVVEVTFDPCIISFEKLLSLFWKIHNPTELNRQGPDVGTQYRSIILCTSVSQEEAAQKAKEELEASGTYRKPIVTQIERLKEFFEAEEYHQKYFAKRGIPSCHIAIEPEA